MLDVGGEQLKERDLSRLGAAVWIALGGVSHLDGAKSSTRALFSAI